MRTINLKKYCYPLFVTDTFIEVSDEVVKTLLLMRREENNRTHKICFTAKSPEEILPEQEEERLFLTTLGHLSEAMNNLQPGSE